MNIEILEQIGLTKSEIKVYLALLELGSSSTGKIVDKSRVASSKVYEILDKLIQKGLVSFIIKAGVKYFEAAPPERIMDYMEEREKRFNKQKQDLKQILPELELKQKIAKYKSEATIYKGYKGVETAFLSALKLLKSGDVFLVMGIPSRSEQMNRFFTRFNRIRAKRNIKMKGIFNEAARGELQTLPKNRPLSEVRYIPETTPAAINIFKDRVMIVPESKEPLVIAIDNKEVAESFRIQFEKWWDQRVQTYQGQDQVEAAMNSLIDKATKKDDIVLFAAKPVTKEGSDYNVKWNKEIRQKAKNVRLLYYGDNEKNRKRAKEIEEQGCETKIYPTEQTLPISTIVQGNTVMNAVWSKDPSIFKIENKTVADSLRTNFDILWDQKATMTRGLKAVYNAWDSMLDELKPGEEYYVMGAADRGQKGIYDYLVDFHKRRQAKGVKSKFLFISGTEKYVEEFKDNYTILSEVKYLPQVVYKGLQFNFFKNKILIIVWREKEPIVFTIEDKKVYDTFKTYFDTLWGQDVKVSKGFKAFERELNSFLEKMKAGDTWDVLGAGYGPKGDEKEYIELFKRLHEKRKAKGVKGRLLFQEGTRKVAEGLKVFEKGELKFLPYKTDSPVAIFPFKTKTIMSIQEKTPTVITIDNEKITQSLKKQFESIWQQDVQVHKGFEAATDRFMSMLDQYKEGEEYYVLGATYGFGGKKLRDWFMKYTTNRIKKKVTGNFLIVPDDFKETIYEFTHTGDPDMKHTNAKKLPPDFSSPMQINLYKGNKVLMFLWGKEMMCFEIESELLYKNFKTYFDALWEQDTVVSHGFKAFEDAWNSLFNKLKPGQSYNV
ncbi:hypothetical protein KY331_05495, partial [Candidatus Woesearchaeota archaeon]|nr:hypothetical protein [Candidatus Woesearchaeota archaeon]